MLENGYDPTTQLEQIALFNKLVDKFEIILDSDPRNTTLRGQEQPAATEERTPSSKAVSGKAKGDGLAALSEEDLGMVKDLLVAGMSRAGGSFESTHASIGAERKSNSMKGNPTVIAGLGDAANHRSLHDASVSSRPA